MLRTYVSKFKQFTIVQKHDHQSIDPETGGIIRISSKEIQFNPEVRPGVGIYQTEDAEEQKFLESSEAMRTGVIYRDDGVLDITTEQVIAEEERKKQEQKAQSLSCGKCGRVFTVAEKLDRHVAKCQG